MNTYLISMDLNGRTATFNATGVDAEDAQDQLIERMESVGDTHGAILSIRRVTGL